MNTKPVINSPHRSVNVGELCLFLVFQHIADFFQQDFMTGRCGGRGLSRGEASSRHRRHQSDVGEDDAGSDEVPPVHHDEAAPGDQPAP